MCFRIAFSAILLWQLWLFVTLGWVSTFWIQPRFHFTYYGFGWVRPLPGQAMYVVCGLLAVLALCMLVGLWYRVSAALFCVGFTYLFLLDEANYLNHLYLICLVSFLLALVPAHRGLSVDAWRTPQLRADTVPRWALWLLRAQFAIVYIHAGIAKINGDWLRGEPLRGWLATRPYVPVVGRLFQIDALVPVFAYGSLLLDLLVVPALLWRRTRTLAVCLLLLFHLLNWQLFDLGIFPWLMIAATVLFLPAGWLRFFRGAARQAAPEAPAYGVLAIAIGYLVVQVLLPLRGAIYPGNTSWTEEGQRFAWRMLVREKRGEATLQVVDPARRLQWGVEPWRHLIPFQLRKMSTQPDLILQLAHRVAGQQRRQGRDGVKVYARVIATLNDHPPQWLVDPRVDLAAEPRSLRPAPWIVPLGAEVPGYPVPSSLRPAARADHGGIVAEGLRRRREWSGEDPRSGPHD